MKNIRSKPTVWNQKKCIVFDSRVAKIVLLANLSSTILNPVDQIISPKQYQSNCWFNVLYMICFVSDKGRKFFKFFRQLMIEGKDINGNKIPTELWNSFALLNLAIEATLTGYNKLEKFDTNQIIKKIYNSIPDDFKNKDDIYRVNIPGNPTDYYNSILKYLNHNKTIVKKIDIDYLEFQNKFKDKESNQIEPEVIVIRIYPNEKVIKDEYIVIRAKGNKITYQLDAIAIIDTKGQHFSCLITYDKKEYGFDGASFKRLNPFNWKSIINKNKTFTFSGSNFNYDPNTPIKWNFMNGYQELFYYKISSVST